jgi:hypothetical protein
MMTDRRNFLRGMVALSAAAVPVAAQAAKLDEWDRLAVGLSLINPNAPKAVANARAQGMRPEWIYTVVTLDTPAHPVLCFETPDGKMVSIGPRMLAVDPQDMAFRD